VKKTEILMMFDYSAWANRRILDAAAGLSQEQFTAPAGLNYGSLRGTLAHILGAEMVWRMRCQEGISPPSLPGEEAFPTLAALRARWAESEQAMHAFLDGLTDEELQRTVRYKTTKGVSGENSLWQLLLHVVNHGTQHRAEAAMTLTQHGCSPGDVDLIVFLRERSQVI
jgi:uncharacterized damage-inducible protein DinB